MPLELRASVCPPLAQNAVLMSTVLTEAVLPISLSGAVASQVDSPGLPVPEALPKCPEPASCTYSRNLTPPPTPAQGRRKTVPVMSPSQPSETGVSTVIPIL